MDKKIILEAKNLAKKFNGFEAIKDISFSVKEGEIMGFLGPNGAGKSTTIFCILGLIEPFAAGLIFSAGTFLKKEARP